MKNGEEQCHGYVHSRRIEMGADIFQGMHKGVLYRIHRKAQLAGDLRRLEPIVPAEQEDPLPLVGHPVKCIRDQPLQLYQSCGGFRRMIIRSLLRSLVGYILPLPARIPLDHPQAFPGSDAAKPCSGIIKTGKLVARKPDAYKSFVKDVFFICFVQGVDCNNIVEQRIIVPEDNAKCIAVAFRYAQKDLMFVIWLIGWQ